MRSSLVRLVFLLLAVPMLGSCAATSVVNQWADPKFADTQFKKVLVIGVAQDEGIRRSFETEFSNQLDKQRGVDGIPSFELIADPEKLEPDNIREAIQGLDIEAVLVTRVVAVDEQQTYVPGRTTVMPYPYYGSFYSYYPMAYETVHTPGYVATDHIYRIETNVYEVGEGALVWSGTSETYNPSKNRQVAIREFSSVILRAMAKDKVL